MSDETNLRALDELVREVREAEAPPLDFTGSEERLFAKIDADEAAQRARKAARPASGMARAFGFAAVAAGIALGFASAMHSSLESPAAPAEQAANLVPAGPNGERELFGLHEGDIVEAKTEAMRFGHDGVVSWTLAPGGRIVVRKMGEHGVGHVVALERGSIRAEVTPRTSTERVIEAFAVEVGGTRVAVHGTAFTVSLVSEGALVDVEHGAVAVGPVGHVGDTSGRLLVGPARALFSLDGGSTSRFVARDGETSRVASAAAPVAADNGALAPASDVSAPEANLDRIASPAPRHVAPHAVDDRTAAEPPSAIEPPAPRVLSRATVQADIARCFREVYGEKHAQGVAFSVKSTFTIALNPDGTVKGASAHFNPPLPPELTLCAGSAIAGRFPAGSPDLTLDVHFGD